VLPTVASPVLLFMITASERQLGMTS